MTKEIINKKIIDSKVEILSHIIQIKIKDFNNI